MARHGTIDLRTLRTASTRDGSKTPAVRSPSLIEPGRRGGPKEAECSRAVNSF
jgi:hypothetical protein